MKNFSRLATPLSNLLKVGENAAKQKNHFISWNTMCQLVFDCLKAALTSAPVLQQVGPQKPFVVETDASDFAIGSCLLEIANDCKLHPVAYESRKLSNVQTHYPDGQVKLIKSLCLGQNIAVNAEWLELVSKEKPFVQTEQAVAVPDAPPTQSGSP
jgi:RNase H-like domain found in reverse transcriptase